MKLKVFSKQNGSTVHTIKHRERPTKTRPSPGPGRHPGGPAGRTQTPRAQAPPPRSRRVHPAGPPQAFHAAARPLPSGDSGERAPAWAALAPLSPHAGEAPPAPRAAEQRVSPRPAPPPPGRLHLEAPQPRRALRTALATLLRARGRRMRRGRTAGREEAWPARGSRESSRAISGSGRARRFL